MQAIWIPQDRTKLGQLDPPVRDPLYPSLMFFLDPRGSYAEMVAYRFLLMAYRAQRYLLAHWDRAVRLLGPHSFPRDVTGAWDVNISITPLTGVAHGDNMLEAPPLVLYARLRKKEKEEEEDTEAEAQAVAQYEV